jgi:glycosyltransferase involved in cell wall biosynthesis
MGKQLVALVDWLWVGHHPTYFVNFAIAIANCGHRVVPFCADPVGFESLLSEELECRGEMPTTGFTRLIEPAVRLEEPRSSGIRPARFRGVHEAWKRFYGLRQLLAGWEKGHDARFDLVFFACIYDWHFHWFRQVERCFGYPWAGLYLHARAFRMPGTPLPYSTLIPRPERFFSSSLFRGAGVLDERAVEPIQLISGGKPVVFFPDSTNEDSREQGADDSGLALKIRRFAQGMPIVSLVGHLQWTKGIEEFTECARHPDMREVFFFLGGELSWYGIDDERRTRLLRLWEELPNVFAHFQYIAEESRINSVISGSDVVFAAYRNFPNSSNIMTKAAVFRRPVMVSEGHVMAERVREYQLGEVVPEGDTEAMVRTLRLMLSPDYRSEMASRARWDEYCEIHSIDRLPGCFDEIIV